ncbi:MAG TPA: hypothetical protein VMV56_01545, partial [Williamwhitmania sp.]|nr:hypothetical protein [Williamwhitmania sp.]
TNDIIKPLWGDKKSFADRKYIRLNRAAIVALAIVAFVMSRNQLLHPKLSVAILAQNGVYAYFSIIFVPILMGVFLKNIKVWIPFVASVVAALTHFSVYYFFPFLHSHGVNFGFYNKYLEGVVRNPAIAASSAIVLSAIVGFGLMYLSRMNPAKQNQ